MNKKRIRLSKKQRINQINHAILQGAKSIVEIAKYMQVSESLVKYYFYKEGRRIERRKISDSLSEIRLSINNGASCLYEISVDTGLTEKTISRYCYDNKIKITQERKTKEFQLQRIRNLIEKGLVDYMEDISHLTNLSVKTIENYLNGEEIKHLPYKKGRNHYRSFTRKKSLDSLIKIGEASVAALARKAGYSRTYVRDYIIGTNQREVWKQAHENYRNKRL